MYFKQGDILKGLKKDFLKKLMDISVKESYEKEDFLFHAGDPASSFYVLLTGRVKIHLEKPGRAVYTVNNAGEAFGWSSLISGDTYSASAICSEPTKLLKFNRDLVLHVVDENPIDGLLFFKQLAAVLGNRLLKSYEMITSLTNIQMQPSFGTGQVMGASDAL